MNKFKIFKYISVCTVLFALFSCSDEGYTDNSGVTLPETEDLPWQANTTLEVTPDEDHASFIWYHDLLTGEDYWGNDEVILNFDLESVLTADQFSKIDFYLTAEEKDGYNYTAPYETSGALLTTVSEWNEEGQFSLTIAADSAYDLFLNKYTYDRSEKLAREGDLFEIHWVITAKNGEVYDSRESWTGDTRFGIQTKLENYAPPIFEGTFTYEYTDATADAEYWGKISVGETGSINFTHLGNQVYSVPNLGFSYNYTSSGTITLDFLSGLITVKGNVEEKWIITKVDGPDLYIDIEYKYSASYNEYFSVKLTRTDGNNWPENIHTE
ncbi:hypothetical protein [Robertkochia solimangrovi]|uniref:hypothetical protein n=1 Tax=Robertkochia solimangrovi TaxID=2213046 RepID=UPI0011803029|nr:hypothetical protein [Robertkochia solimangrovi]TRZ45735.1 hypothetical protein DMZ48_00185 [Robertkochia solimangrovi]